MPNNVLLIGGSRFLGCAIADAFAQHGEADLYILNRGSRPAPEGGRQLVCDIADRDAFRAVLKSRPWDVVIDTILSDQDLAFVVDVLGSDLGHFIHTGSLGVYGRARRIPAPESLPLCECAGEEVVFDQKLRQDQLLLRAHQEQAFPATVLRMSYIYGAGDIPLDGWGGRSPEFFRMIRERQTVPVPDNGRALLHPGHVRDLGRSFLHAALRPRSIGQIYNIAGSHALMMKDYICLIAEAMGVALNIETLPLEEILARYPDWTTRRGMKFSCQHMCASIAKAERELNWFPETPLETGLRENIEWMQKQRII